uniref:Uncharacterized protein n=1 Tax=viral metagenome TaxID=1070528 RepID=A0A6H2A615_9ZZZZ
MPQKYNDNSNEYKDWTTKKLKQEAKDYHEIIHNDHSCYGKQEFFALDGILHELDSRGITPQNNLTF